MNHISTVAILFLFKLIVIIGFVMSMKAWLKKKNNIVPVILYWILGLFFVFMLSFQIAEWFLMQFYYIENQITRDAKSIGALSAIIALFIYIYTGIKYFKRKKIA